ncbi:PTS system, N-acetylglucosamine-specific IIA component / PTS system, N-acetylglucosamine-specific IIB component / PTS system, N-acetylglucosamine-specific IIC component [Sphingobium indicum BiD32]|uniref:PTS system, N-acetylglucosamine-specific IIA component / PTS system, N-acetylglucosamine-specific IIB component / PTS system, N-acetylglucosamine-specific IIC component n=1 Tax=Sphingobium indicum BiD32 TaxID=1301087 RepID=N1MPW1_9SPHN|nr:N-acetylglucosamine-specific PTS transporter subunit IIBC [Sphingobium indicum]CCW19250.1 PTS system, N-acetylglucosamine-specific IIA component / PTS system, N-acetylglucosamine-specific IIB component / PTS system, N-acetylglucosamine-specific IIC component [Sphingobium indicum BiD32]
MRKIVGSLQPIGRALMLPIAVLPIAGLLLRLGQPDLLGIPLLAAAGDALFSSLGLLFAIGVATGIARDGNGAAALAGVVCYLVTMHGGRALIAVPSDVIAGLTDSLAQTVAQAWKARAFARLDVPIGIASGLIGGSLYNRYATISVPAFLSFFGGRRFVPIVAGAAGVGLALAVGGSYAMLDAGLDHASHGLVASGHLGLFGFGVINRLLLVTGLHHILNNVAWFVLGDFNGTTGDLRRFFAGDPHAGAFMAGFFPVMMFGLPAACLAIYRAALPDQKKAVGGMLLSLALTSFLTGVTEPIEFSFMFLAPLLYAIHAVLTGIAMVIMDVLGVRLGFGFSAGLFDYLLNFGRATRPWLLLPVGVAYFLTYYSIFSFAIRRFNLATPGRQPAEAQPDAVTQGGERGAAYLAALGGSANLQTIGACTTRLRLVVRDQAGVNDAALKALGAVAVLRPSAQAVQVIIGPIADQVSEEIRLATTQAVAPSQIAPVVAEPPASAPVEARADIVAALGGAEAIVDTRLVAGRLRISLQRPVDIDALATITDVRGVACIDDRTLHIIGQDLTR